MEAIERRAARDIPAGMESVHRTRRSTFEQAKRDVSYPSRDIAYPVADGMLVDCAASVETQTSA
ncbi:MAG TPA: hypothetical protein VIQ54_18310, partial [Polyangia bacterium]